jgi:hypothetical protein
LATPEPVSCAVSDARAVVLDTISNQREIVISTVKRLATFDLEGQIFHTSAGQSRICIWHKCEVRERPLLRRLWGVERTSTRTVRDL